MNFIKKLFFHSDEEVKIIHDVRVEDAQNKNEEKPEQPSSSSAPPKIDHPDRVFSSKIDKVENPMKEVHYVFSRKYDGYDEDDDENVFYDLIFTYIFHRPAVVVDKHCPFGRFLYFFETHEMYEGAIQYMIDHRKDANHLYYIDYVKSSTQRGEAACAEYYSGVFNYMFDFRDPYAVFGRPDVKTEDIFLIQDRARSQRLDRTIRSLSFFTDKILAFAPYLEFQTCDECGKETLFQDQYINIDPNNDSGVTSCCEECLQTELADNPHFKMAPDHFQEIRATIDKFFLEYLEDQGAFAIHGF